MTPFQIGNAIGISLGLWALIALSLWAVGLI
jgi:hypothetical protein